jgi:hypothetical protein
MWRAVAMPPYGGIFTAVDPLEKHIFRGPLIVFSAPALAQRLAHGRLAEVQLFFHPKPNT